jgi:hypothetical protein
MRQVLTLILGVALLAWPATSQASDPLLSGYGGPGNGEQALLGGELVDDGGSGGSTAASAPARSAAQTSLAAPTPAAATGPSTAASPSPSIPAARPKAKRPRRATTLAPVTPTPTAPAAPGAATATAATPGAPAVIPYADAGADSSALPLSTADVVVALLFVVALALVALGLRSVAGGVERADPSLKRPPAEPTS